MMFIKNLQRVGVSACLSGLAVCLFATAAQSAVVFDNLAQTPEGGDSISGLGPLYASFTTPNWQTTLGSVKLKLYGSGEGLIISVGLYSDVSTSPGEKLSALASIDETLVVGSPVNYRVALDETPTLQANTRYWIGLSGGSSVLWSYTDSSAGTGVANEHFANFSGGDLNVFNNNVDMPYQMQVIAVPEPVEVALLTFLACAGARVGYRRLKKA